MLYFILENSHKIELTHKRVTFIEKNPWFETEFNSEYSFPFEMHASEFVKITDFTHYNSIDAKTQFKGKLYKDGQLTDATLKIQQQKGAVISGIIFSGLDAFPNFDKQLSELPLDKFNVPNLKNHALSIIGQGYPEVSHNFSMVHTDKYDPASEDFNDFQKIINNMSNGAFVENIIQPDNNIDLVRNIMQPFPYLMHVVNKAIESAGFILEGDILEIDDFKKALIFRDAEYYNLISRDSIPFRAKNEEWNGLAQIVNGHQHVSFLKTLIIERKADYIISGSIISLLYTGFADQRRSDLYVSIGYQRGNIATSLYTYQLDHQNGNEFGSPKTHSLEIDITVQLWPGDILFVNKTESRRDLLPSPTPDYPEAFALELIPIRYRNPDNTPILSLLDLKEVDLTRVVPDMTVGDLFKILQAWKNLDFKIFGNIVRMDFIQPQLNRNEAKDLSDFDIEEPLRTFTDERSYEISFTDGKNNLDYPYDSIFVTRNGTFLNDYKTNKNTTPVTIDGLPYPVISRNGITTAFAVDNEASKLRLIFYRPSVGQAPPICYGNQNMLIPAVYENDYKLWLKFLVFSVSYDWNFIISVEKMKDIMINSIIFCYGNYHIFSDTERERINKDFWRVSAKSESLV